MPVRSSIHDADRFSDAHDHSPRGRTGVLAARSARPLRARRGGKAPARPGPSPTPGAGRSAISVSRSRTAATSAASTACPKEIYDANHEFLPRAELLTFEEITRLARIFVDQGVTKLRLTGGEPLLRRNIERLVEMLARLGDIDLTLTTNGALLAKKARSLRDAGLTRVTVSLDSLDDATFPRMNDVDFPVAKVLAAIDAAAAAGLAPSQGQHGGQARSQRGVDRADGAALQRAAATSSATSSTWTWARPTAGGWTTW
jgi:hypothetical protein